MEGQIFINYRRNDSAASAGRLYDRLSNHFRSCDIFMDVDTLDPGVDFVEAIEQRVGSCDVLISIIGKHWLNSLDDEGKRRLDKADDFVRLEIATALKLGVRVIPVLVEGALMPQARDLPDDLKPLVRRNALEVSHGRFKSDCARLVSALERVLEGVRTGPSRVENEGAQTVPSEAGAERQLAEITPVRMPSKPSAPMTALGLLGSYRVLRDSAGAPVVLGKGSWGEVYKAFNSHLRCYAALRVIPRDAFANDEFRESFEGEVRKASHFRHRRVSSIFPLEFIDGNYLYGTQYCAGETLADRVASEGCLATRYALDIVGQIAVGLDAACGAGLLHRNIAPWNVILLQEDEEVSARLLDLALPAKCWVKRGSDSYHECDFRSPEESGGRSVDIQSGVYSLGGLLYYMHAGAEKFALFRPKAADEREVSHNYPADVSPEVAAILRKALCKNPSERFGTFSELSGAINEILTAPTRSSSEGDSPSIVVRRADNPIVLESMLSPGAPQEPKSPPEMQAIRAVEKTAAVSAGRLMIPAELLGVAQPGKVVRFKLRSKTTEQYVACARNCFRIGRSSSAADLVTIFLPRSGSNDVMTKRLSRIHATARYQDGHLCLLDGDGVDPSANGATFDSRPLSPAMPTSLLKEGDLRLAEIYLIRVIPKLLKHDDWPSISNIGSWRGPTREADGMPLTGAVIFVPKCRSGTSAALWLFTTALFASSETSPLNFALADDEHNVGALHYYRECFWIEQKASNSLLVDGVVLMPGEIAPLSTGQSLEIGGCEYSVEVEAA
ncbi:MAG TPA: TIR domain-containing protein [Terrimicrobiaceae bacterium]